MSGDPFDGLFAVTVLLQRSLGGGETSTGWRTKIVKAVSLDEAVGMFTREISDAYPGAIVSAGDGIVLSNAIAFNAEGSEAPTGATPGRQSSSGEPPQPLPDTPSQPSGEGGT